LKEYFMSSGQAGGKRPHTVEKIGGTSMSNFATVCDNVLIGSRSGADLYHRIFVVSAYGGVTDLLLEHKRSGEPGVYALFAHADDSGEGDEGSTWQARLEQVAAAMVAHNARLFSDEAERKAADDFILERIEGARTCLMDLQRVCSFGHFQLAQHLQTVRELLASLGEAHSAWNTAALLRAQGVNARFVDLSGWRNSELHPLDETIRRAFADIDLSRELPVVTGYCQCEEGLMRTFDRGYSEMTFSRIAVLTGAREAIIHKEFHLSSADPRIVDAEQVVPIGRTNYDVADQLANLGMEAIHPRAAKGLRQQDIPLRVKNTFEPEHGGTLITRDYVSRKPCVEIIAGRKHVIAIEVFDQEMVGANRYDTEILEEIRRFKARIITKDLNANTITHFLDTNLKTAKRIDAALRERFPSAEVNMRTVAIVSAIGSDMQVPGMLARTVQALASVDISVLAMHQSMRQVDMQFVLDEKDYEAAIQSLHAHLIEPLNHGQAICAA
jgi:aspartate kinase